MTYFRLELLADLVRNTYSFAEQGFVSWNPHRRSFAVGDTVYLFSSRKIVLFALKRKLWKSEFQEQSKISAHRKNEELWEKAELEGLYAEDVGGRRWTVTEEDILSEMTSQDGVRQTDQRSSGGSTSTGRRRGWEPRPGDPDYREYRMWQYYENTDAEVRTSEAQKDSISRAAASGGPEGNPQGVVALHHARDLLDGRHICGHVQQPQHCGEGHRAEQEHDCGQGPRAFHRALLHLCTGVQRQDVDFRGHLRRQPLGADCRHHGAGSDQGQGVLGGEPGRRGGSY